MLFKHKNKNRVINKKKNEKFCLFLTLLTELTGYNKNNKFNSLEYKIDLI
jgi:hypothetical protein